MRVIVVLCVSRTPQHMQKFIRLGSNCDATYLIVSVATGMLMKEPLCTLGWLNHSFPRTQLGCLHSCRKYVLLNLAVSSTSQATVDETL